MLNNEVNLIEVLLNKEEDLKTFSDKVFDQADKQGNEELKLGEIKGVLKQFGVEPADEIVL